MKTPTPLPDFVGQMLNDIGAAASGALVLVGDRLGLFAALAAQPQPCDAATLAASAGDLDARYVREWLLGMAASNYVCADDELERFHLSDAQRTIFADPDSPLAMAGGFYSLASIYSDESKVVEAFRTKKGIPWGDHHQCLFCGTERFFRTAYLAHLLQEWIPALDGVTEKLEQGALVADVGCGHGCSTTIMAKAFPNSRFIGFDVHAPSVDHAAAVAVEQGLSNVEFKVATAQDFPGLDYDLVTCFDCLHDMGDPVGAGSYIRKALKPGGTWMIVEPMAGDTPAQNMNPVGRIFYAFSTMVCTPGSRSQPVGLALGAQAGEKRLREVVVDGSGFRGFRRAAETPFNIILEAKP